MAKTDLKTILSDLGLQKLEIEVYLASLQAGSGAASVIARIAGQNRVTTYEILKRLSKKGFVKIRAKQGSKTKYFTPEDLLEIKSRLQSRISHLEDSLENIDEVKDEFKALYRLNEKKPVVLFYDGKEGVRSVLNDIILQKPPELLSFASADWLDTSFNKEGFLDKYWKDRVANNIPCRCIVPETKEGLKFFNEERNKKEMRFPRFLSPATYDFKNEINIYNDSVNIISISKGNEHSIIIRSESIAKSMRELFRAMWELSKTK
ncbi:MAG: helix-turn-helix domain-containing protein [Candidatus Pacebacteria bacterium]|nr:helix-turn-helix domain-containing protein [Candidatus Paceibacterota bacterium]